jgi:uncharacterized peroxidase-related enzyme
MQVFPSIAADPDLAAIFRRFPHAVAPLLTFHDRILRDPSPLTVAQRELIAAYVSGLNACTFCHGAHRVAAEAFGVDDSLMEALMADPETSPVEPALKPLLAYARKLTLTPTRIVQVDVDAVYAAGWDEQALFDAISVCALFNMMNRIVEGSGIRRDPLADAPEERAARRQRMGTPGDDPHRAPHSYSRLLALYGIEADGA